MTTEALCAKHCTLASCRKATCIVFEQRAGQREPDEGER